MIHPVTLGGGTPLIPAGTKLDLDLVDSHVFGSGAVYLRYGLPSPRPSCEGAMRFLLLVQTPTDPRPPAVDDDELATAMEALLEEMAQSGVLLDAAGLRPVEEAVRVRLSHGSQTVVNGPFTTVCEPWSRTGTASSTGRSPAASSGHRMSHLLEQRPHRGGEFVVVTAGARWVGVWTSNRKRIAPSQDGRGLGQPITDVHHPAAEQVRLDEVHSSVPAGIRACCHRG